MHRSNLVADGGTLSGSVNPTAGLSKKRRIALSRRATTLAILCLVGMVYVLILSLQHSSGARGRLPDDESRNKNDYASPSNSKAPHRQHTDADLNIQQPLTQQQGTILVSELRWNRKIYLPLSADAGKGFRARDATLHKRLLRKGELSNVWGVQSPLVLRFLNNSSKYEDISSALEVLAGDPFAWMACQGGLQGECESKWRRSAPPFSQWCLREVPECEFFLLIGNVSLSFVKCCQEHYKLKSTLTDLIQVFGSGSCTAANRQLFLDSGTLLSSIRDGGDTLLPWETDVDLGIVGSQPSLDGCWSPAVTTARHRFTEQCLTEQDGKKCRDAHYVYYVETAQQARRDSSRVEIWPLHDDSAASGLLLHPTRAWNSVRKELVEPLRPCQIWGLDVNCPHQSKEYLDVLYQGRDNWVLPRTTHWGRNNIEVWRRR